MGPLANLDRLAERLLRSLEVHPPVPPAHTGHVRADKDQAAVPSGSRCSGLPFPAEMGPAARPHRSPAGLLSCPANTRLRAARSPRRIPPPCSQTLRRHPIPVRIACCHSSWVLTDTSSA